MKEKKEINIQIGERIKHSRENANYTQEKFADMIGVTVQYVSDLERGVVGTSIPTLIKICETLKISSDYIIMGKTETTDISDIVKRLQYLDSLQINTIEKAINLIIDAFEYKS